MRAIPHEPPNAYKYLDKRVKDTHDREGRVIDAFISRGVISLRVVDDRGLKFWTDSEHATLVRDRDAT